ncbi:SurA N-terminal domain-containing protein [Gallaecimonas kandeliae]|uniref:SurA N-terminal domain-containing protein n=1 Tax=Gallaecimonas kandeliae TaxID=3029055 RepID=UPI0026478C36|nr:SurA N-terminal domain-containing protein [Gallaecimonas kandeliae]WKE64141.1 SurA N-terminal domain-containing protein [Gallaecimonas kandeliae]
MMEQIREGSQNWVVKIILGFIILSFALTGVYSYLRGGPHGNAAAEVNGQSISRVELERAYQNERARMEAQSGDMFKQLSGNDAFMQQLRKGALEQLVNQHLVADAISDMGLRVSDSQVKDAILGYDAFKIDGKFDNDRYLAVLRNQGLTPSKFSEMVRVDLARQQFVDGVISSTIVLPEEAKTLYAASRQTRDIQVATVKAADFVGKVQVSDDEIKARYDSQPQGYMAPEQVAIDYLELSEKALEPSVTVSDQEISDYYKDNANQFKRPEKRRSSHILFTGKDAEAKAAAALKEIQGGKDFADVAKAESQDTFSATKGGDLGWNEQGVLDPGFDKALFAIAKEGDVAGPVKSAFGYHLIKLTGIQAGETKSLDEVKAEIKAQLTKKAAEDLFYKKQDELERLAFENPDSLVDAAKAVGLEVKHLPLFARAKAPAALNYPKVLDAAFSESVKLDKVNSEVIEAGPEHVFVVRASDFKDAHRKSLDEVKAEIQASLQGEKAKAKAEATAQALLDKLNAKEDVTAWLTENGLKFETFDGVNRNDTKVAPAVGRSAFSQQPGGRELVSLADGDSAVVEVKAVHAYEPKAEDQPVIDMWQKRLAQQREGDANRQFIDALRKTADIKVFNTDKG